MIGDWKVELVRVGAVHPAALRMLREDLVRLLLHPVWIADWELDPAPAFDLHRQQYSASDLLEILLRRATEPGIMRIGITDVDLFLPVFTHVFGSAQLGGPAAIASTFRLPADEGSGAFRKRTLHERLLKEVVHELGHTLGLAHCRVALCVMNASRLAEQIDLKDAAFCDVCSERISVPPVGFRPR